MGGGGGEGGGVGVPSLPLPCPRSPPEYPDLYGRRREFARVQMLEREIGFLQEELKSVEGFQPASRCCKEVVDFSLGNSDPLIPTFQKRSASRGFWKWLCGDSWLNFSWICCCCCYTVCPPDLELPCRCTCNSCILIPECHRPNCSLRKWLCFSCHRCPDCCKPNRYYKNCDCCCFGRPKCTWSCNKRCCPKSQLCLSCKVPCCNSSCYYCH